MTREEIEKKIMDLKSDYIRIQADLEKLVYTGGNSTPGDKILENIEQELRSLRQQLAKLNQ